MTGRLILIGMPASGKTTIGSALSALLSAPFYDADAWIERAENRSIPEIFARSGESGFRIAERRALQTLCAAPAPCVIATGGGAVLSQDNRALLRESGTVFWLDRALESIMSTDYSAGRPLLSGGEEALRALYAARRPLYDACAQYRVPDGTIPEVTGYILKLWRDVP